MVVTIATGRLTSGTYFIAEELGLDAPLICADGGITACAATRKILARRPIPTSRVDGLLEAMAARKLASFVFTHGAIHSCERGVVHHPYVATWSPVIATHADIAGARAWRDDLDGPVMVLAMGDHDAIDDLTSVKTPDLETLAFTLKRVAVRAVRFVVRGVSKGAALADLAGKLGVEQKNVAVAGDWYNDLSMFAWAGRSFAMPQAPADVKAEATDVLDEVDRSSSEDVRDPRAGGGVAQALTRWLSDGT